jgi:Raf kinase inhibitor-like YbhB/YbcL family protein
LILAATRTWLAEFSRSWNSQLSPVAPQSARFRPPKNAILRARQFPLGHFDAGFYVKSANFENNSTLPISMIDNYAVNGVNSCSSNGAPGGDQAPQLTWTHTPWGTRSFVVTGFDETASFTHWGMYNIAPDVRSLPANAGAAGSPYGTQITNDFGSVGYEGPCPPPNYTPTNHHHLFTVYALDELLELPASTDFPAAAETLLHALAAAGARGHVLNSATISGFYSTAPAT